MEAGRQCLIFPGIEANIGYKMVERSDLLQLDRFCKDLTNPNDLSRGCNLTMFLQINSYHCSTLFINVI